MKTLAKKHYIYTKGLAFLALAILLASCASIPSEPEIDPNFLGDLNPIQLEDVICVRESLGSLKATEVRLFFIPRTNIIEAYLRDGMTAYVLLFESEDRQNFIDGIMTYGKAYATYTDGDTSTLPEREANRSNYFNTGTMSVSWGVAAPVRNNTTTFQTNYKYLEPNKPYFELLVETTKDADDSSMSSPVLRLYFAPAQLELLLEQIDQANLQQLVDDLEEAAFAF